MNTDAIAACMRASLADTPFPEIVARLAGAGVRAYSADLVTLRTSYYDGETEAADESIPLENAPAIADAFDSIAVEAAVRAIQAKRIGYAEFLRRIMIGGCARYSVFLGGRKAVYIGRDGDFWTEPFAG